VCLLAAVAATLWAQSARRIAHQARIAEKNGEFSKAFLLYAQAAAANPADPRLWALAQTVRARAMMESRMMPPAGDLDEAAPGDPITAEELAESRRPQPPVELEGAPGPHAFDLSGNSREVWEKAASKLGLAIVFDGDYQPLERVRFRISDATFRDAVYALSAATSSFLVPVSPKVALVARDSPQKRQDLEPNMTITVPLTHPVGAQEAQELARTVQQTFELQRFGIDNARRIILVRDRTSKVKPAVEMLERLLRHRAEVMIDIELLEVSENYQSSYGATLPTRSPLYWLSSIWGSKADLPEGIFLGIGGGRTFIALGVSSAEMFATFSKIQAKSVMRASLRTLDTQAVTFHLGDRYPVLTQGYFGPSSGGSDVYTPPPTFTFEDLGLVLKATPKVHGTEEVSLEVDAEFKVLAGEALNGIPVISNRRINSRARMRFGEWAVLGGLMRSSDVRAISGPAGVARLPVVGRALRQNDKTTDRGETLVLLKPRLLSEAPGAEDSFAIWVGSEARLRTPM
jgi:general secretion pathway protein D